MPLTTSGLYKLPLVLQCFCCVLVYQLSKALCDVWISKENTSINDIEYYIYICMYRFGIVGFLYTYFFITLIPSGFLHFITLLTVWLYKFLKWMSSGSGIGIYLGLKRKCLFPCSQKCKISCIISPNFVPAEIDIFAKIFAQISQTFSFLRNFRENHPTLFVFPFFQNQLIFLKSCFAHCFCLIGPKTNIFAKILVKSNKYLRENLPESHGDKIFAHKWSLCSWLVLHFCNKL